MKLLLYGEDEKNNLAKVKNHAEENHFSFDDLLDIKNGHEVPCGDRPGFSCILPPGIRIVYSIEAQPKGLARHVSISCIDKKYPNTNVCSFLMKELGFKTTLNDCLEKQHVYKEEYSHSISIIEYMN